jgi:Zn finger protein HypA/HybF involved in hydrogenase expression
MVSPVIAKDIKPWLAASAVLRLAGVIVAADSVPVNVNRLTLIIGAIKSTANVVLKFCFSVVLSSETVAVDAAGLIKNKKPVVVPLCAAAGIAIAPDEYL